MSSKRKRINLMLSALVTLLLLLNWAWTPDSTRPNFITMPEMVYSPAYRAFSQNPHFRDGKTLQKPPEHALPIGTDRIQYGATPEDAVRAGEDLRSPFRTIDNSIIAQGREVFETFCFPCHGSEAQGNGPVVLRGFPAPPSLTAEKTVGLKDGQMFHIVTYGQGNMPPYMSLVSPRERWLVIAFARSLQESSDSQ